MSVGNSVKAINLLGIDTAGIQIGSYNVINAAGLPQACFKVRIINASNINVTVSFDGVTDNDIVLANTTSDLAFQTNSQPSAYVALMSKGTKIYISASAPGVGFVYVTGYYQI